MKTFYASKVVNARILNKLLTTLFSCFILNVVNADIVNPISQISAAIDEKTLEKIEEKGEQASKLIQTVPVKEDDNTLENGVTATENNENSENNATTQANQPISATNNVVGSATVVDNEITQLLATETTTTLKDLYQANNFNPIWINSADKRKFLDDYILVALSGTDKAAWDILKKISDTTGLEQDIAITRALLDYANYTDLAKQRIQHMLYDNKNYRSSEPKQASIAKLKQAINDKNLNQYLNSLEPTNSLYAGNLNYVKNVLVRNVKADTPVTATLRFNARGQQVVALVNKLKAKKYLPLDFSSDVYDETVLAAVKQFQIDNKMKPDGVIGAKSRVKLNDNALYLAYKVALNSQRIRMLSNYSNGLFVNIPSFALKYYSNGELKLTSRVIVGKGERKTPVMFSRLSDVVLNPPWNTPTKLINEDIIPKVKNDPSYIYRNGYTIIDSKGRSVDPYTIDWENYNSKKFPYRLRQRPSGNSALGSYKFNMPSKDAIFLHDTPSKGLFNRNQRALSSGCIRVEQSKKLANLLLDKVGFNETLQQEALRNKKTKFVKLNNNTPVFIYYMTAWVDKGTGNVRTLSDLYGYDRVNMNNINWDLLKKVYNLN